jgi:hypothetical protein
MTETEAIEMLGKLKDFMVNTNKQIETLINKTHNLEVDIDKLKKSNFQRSRLIL